MKKRYYVLTAIISSLVILIATLPARSITPLLNDNPQLSLQGVTGTLWNGSASMISINNKVQLNDTSWHLIGWKMLTGKIAIELNSHYQGNNINGEVGSTFLGTYFVNNLTASLAASELAQLANIPLVQLSGEIFLDINHAKWKQGSLPVATGKIDWNNAAVTVAETVPLGNVSIVLSESDKQQLHADVKNQGGDIKISGNAELIPDTDYAVNIKLFPSASASDNIKQSLGLFAKQQRNGEFLFVNTGSLNQIGLI